MYHLLLPAVRDILIGTNKFGEVTCGTGGKVYPLANVILRESAPKEGATVETAEILVQVQSAEGDDSEESYLATMELISASKSALHEARLPGHGAKRLQAKKVQTVQVRDTGEFLYYLPVSVIVDPAQFTTT